MSEIYDTLGWHAAVDRAKSERFGEQPFHVKVRLATTLIREETKELQDELASISYAASLGQAVSPTLVHNAAKEAADVLFVVMQAMHTLGVPFEAVYAEVLHSNWSKLMGDSGAQFREDGKLLKGPNYREADVPGVFRALAEAEANRQRAQAQWEIGLGFRPE